MFPTISPFSAGYELLENVHVRTGAYEYPQMNEYLYAEIQDTIYDDHHVPILLRHPGGNRHFGVDPVGTVEVDTLNLPLEWAEDIGVTGYSDDDQFFIARPEHAHVICHLSTLGEASVR